MRYRSPYIGCMVTLQLCSCPSIFNCQRTFPGRSQESGDRSQNRSDLLTSALSMFQRRSLLLAPGFYLLRAMGADLVGLGRIELPTSPLSGVRSSQLSYRPSAADSGQGPEDSTAITPHGCVRPSLGAGAASTWWSWSGSNRRPPECKSGALPTELQPRPL